MLGTGPRVNAELTTVMLRLLNFKTSVAQWRPTFLHFIALLAALYAVHGLILTVEYIVGWFKHLVPLAPIGVRHRTPS